MDCNCAELIIRGQRQPPPKFRCCEYVRERSALVPEAEKIVNERVKIASGCDGVAERNALWAKAFALCMDVLAEPLLNGAAASRQ